MRKFPIRYCEAIVLDFTAAVARLLQRFAWCREPRVLLLPPAAPGSLGDQAMLDAACCALTEKRTVRVAILNHYPGTCAAPVRRHTRIVNSSQTKAFRILQSLWMISTADAIAILGADVLDGTYSPQTVSFKLRLARMILNRGGVAVVFGSSISETPNPDVMRTLRATEDLTLFARDEVSLARFRRELGRSPGLTADIAFLLTPGIDSKNGKAAMEWVERKRAAGQTIMAANASGHTVARAGVGSVKAYATVLKDWLERDSARAVLLVPHDSRPAPTGDVEPVSHIYNELAPLFEDRIQAVQFPVDAWEIKAIVGGTHVVMTGRMHLAIAALGMGVPPVCITYQEKFEGLMRHFGLEEEGLLVEPTTILQTERVAKMLEQITTRIPRLRKRILRRLPDVIELSKKNLEPFESAPCHRQRRNDLND